MLSALLVWRGFILICMSAYIWVEGPREGLPAMMLAFGLNVLAYAVSRTPLFPVGAGIVILESLIVVPTTVVRIGTLHAISEAPIWLCMGTLISSLVLPFRYTALTVIATIGAFFWINAKVGPQYTVYLANEVLFTVLVTALVLMATRMRDKAFRMLSLEHSKYLQAAKLTTLGEMAGGLAHEINTPLATIQLRAEQIGDIVNDQADESLKKEIVEPVEGITATVARIVSIIRGLRTFARNADEDPFKPLEIGKWVSETLSLCSAKMASEGIRLESPSFKQTIEIKGQSTRLSQAFLNLLTNAIDAVHHSKEKWIRVEVREVGQSVEVAVVDSGEGMTKKAREKLFQPFFSTKEIGKRMGLGLSTAKGIIESHGGKLFFDADCKHTRFVIRLPETKAEKIDAGSGTGQKSEHKIAA